MIGWNASGGHFCFVGGCGETVFYVDPAAQPGQCVHPVARSFADLLSLITACSGTSSVCHAYHWSRLRFEEAVRTARPGPKQAAILRALRNGYPAQRIADPYAYLQTLQEEFDYSSLSFSEDYDEWSPIRPGNWDLPVFFGNDAPWEKKAFRSYPVGKKAQLGSREWFLPAVYTCGSGIVIDLYTRIDADTIRTYLEKWPADHAETLGNMETLLMRAEDPFQCPLCARLSTPGGDYSPAVIRKWTWDPYLDNSGEVLPFLRSFRCSRESGWVFLRLSFPCKPRKKLNRIYLTISEEASIIPGACFEVTQESKSFPFTDPVSGQDHTLTVESCTQEELDPNFLYDDPRHYTRLTYTTDPAIPAEELTVCDCADSDIPRYLPETESPVLGGAAIRAGDPGNRIPWPEKDGAGIAISARHYVPAQSVRWVLLFRKTGGGSVTIPIC